MSENSKIEWTDHTFNPWMGCTKVSPACKNCYAERDFDHRYKKVQWGPNGTRKMTTAANWQKVRRCDREAERQGKRVRVFCASLADVFEDWKGPMIAPDGKPVMVGEDGFCTFGEGERAATMNDARRDLFRLIDDTPNVDWLLLTKRPENVPSMWPVKSNAENHRPNVWLGTSIENQEWADRRLDWLHAAKRYLYVSTTFVSAEPLVGPIILHGSANGKKYNHLGEGGIDWVITGGESGPNARPADPDWFRSLRDQCLETGTAFHFKQWGEFDESQERVGKKNAGRLLDGETHDGLPVAQPA